MPLESLLPLLNFAMGFSGFVLGVWPPLRPKSRASFLRLKVFFVAFLVTGAATLWQHWRQSCHVQSVSVEVLQTLGQEAKSIDQIQEGLPQEDFTTIVAALAALAREGGVGSRIADVRDAADLRYRARFYFAVE